MARRSLANPRRSRAHRGHAGRKLFNQPCAIGRKNWLVCGNDTGGRTAAIFFTLAGSAKRHALDPFAWLCDLLTRLPQLRAQNHPVPHQLLQPLLPNL